MKYYIVNGTFYGYTPSTTRDELRHYGVPGMRWGHRKKVDAVASARASRRQTKQWGNVNSARAAYKQAQQGYRAGTQTKQAYKQAASAYKQAKKTERATPEAKAERVAKAKKAAKIGAAVAATALAAYGAYKLNQYVKSKNGAIAAKHGYEFAEKTFKANLDGLRSGPGKLSGTLSANSGMHASNARARAANDSFVTALKNVTNYARSGQKLSDLPPASYYEKLRGSSITFG